MHQKVVYAGQTLSCQALDQRFTPQAEQFLRQLLSETLCHQVWSSPSPSAPGLLGHFAEVYILDSTTVSSQTKLLTCLNLTNAELRLEIASPRTHDKATALAHASLPSGSLSLTDLGFFDLQAFATCAEQGGFWLTRYKTRTRLFDPHTGQALDLLALLNSQNEL